jgi:uncharacterized membrane protein YhhN
VPHPRALLAAFAAVTAANLVAAGVESGIGMWLTKPLLIPLLAAYLLVRTDGRADRRVLVALAFATAGDIALLVPGTVAFVVGMALFLGAHLAYIAAFTRGGRRPPVPAVAAYGVLTVAALVWMWPGLTDAGLALPIAVYSVALAAMASTAAAHGWRVGAGGGLFLVSDLLIALDVAEVGTLPGPPIWVMATYALGQALIVTGWASSSRLDRSASTTPSSSPNPARR